MKEISPSIEQARPVSSVPSAWLTPGRFAGILVVLLLSCFPSILLGFEAFVYGDSGQFAYPAAFFHRESFWRGEIPFWNPLNSCGIPFLAQWNTLACYPPSLFYLLFPLPWSFDVFCLGHILLAAVGMYFLANHWTKDRFAAAIAGVAFGFNGLIWQAIMWPHFLAALAWMPWLIMAMEKAWASGGRALVLAALAGAMQMLSGGVEVIIQTWLLLAALWLVQFFRSDVPRGKLICRMLAVGLLIAGLSAIQIFPFLDLLAHSQRTSNYGSGGMSGIGDMQLSGLLNYLVPLFRCVRDPQGFFVQAGQSWVGSYYVGIGAVALALLAAWRVRQWRVWFLAGLVVFGLLMALGDSGLIYPIAKKLLPFLGFVRFSVKFVALVTFAVPLLAAFGIGRLCAAPADGSSREWFTVKILGLALVGGMAAVLVYACVRPLAGEDLAAITVNAVVRMLMLVLFLGGIVLLQKKQDLKMQRLLQVAVLALLWFDVFTHTSNLSPAAPSAILKPGLIRSYFDWDHQLEAGTSRALESRDALWKAFATGANDVAMDTYFRRRALQPNLNLLDHVAKFDGFYSLDLKEHLEIFKRVFFLTNDAPQLENFLGISHVSNPTNIFDWVTRDSFLPLVTAGQRPVFSEDAEALQGIFANNFDPAHMVYLPTEASGKVHATGHTDAKAILTRFSYQRLEIQTESSAPAMVTIAQTFYHPWRAYVDGGRVELWRANYGFQALEVPSGKHQVELRYEDTVFLYGVVVSLLSAFACVAMWLFWRQK